MNMIEITDGLQVYEGTIYQSIYAILCATIGVVAVISAITDAMPKNLLYVGIFFFLGGILMGWIAESKTTILKQDGSCSIQYKRNFGPKKWLRYFKRDDIIRIDYVVGHYMGSGQKQETIYIALKTDEQVEIGSRLNQRVYANRLGFFTHASRTPLIYEAQRIANFLQVPLNMVDMLSVSNSIKHFNTPKDKMKFVFQRPSQTVLDKDKNSL